MNILMLSWVAAYLPHSYHLAILSIAGSNGYCAFKRSLQPGYPAHTILATNVDIIEDLSTADRSELPLIPPPYQGQHPYMYSVIYKATPLLKLRRKDVPSKGFLHDTVRIQVPPPPPTTTSPATNSNNIDDEIDIIPSSTATIRNEIDDDIEEDDSAHSSQRYHHLSLISNIRHYPPGFLSRCEAHTIDLSGLCSSLLPQGVVTLCDWFMAYCPELTSVKFGPSSTSSVFSTIKVIPMCFLEKCPKLKSLDLRIFRNVTTIPVWFLQDCISLASLSFPTWGNVTELPYGFLEGCSGLVTIDLSGFENVVKIGRKFMFGCSSVKTIDLTPLTSLVSLPASREGFLGGCSSLVSVDMTGMVWLDVVRERGEKGAVAHILLDATSATYESDDDE